MVIFGGLEIVAGGYLVHRHYRKKKEEERLQDEAQRRRHHTFPGAHAAKPYPNGWNTQAQHRPQHHQPQPQAPLAPQYRYACYASSAVASPPQYQAQSQFQHQHQRPHPETHTQSFNIPRRAVPQPHHKVEIIIEPSLQRTDSFATISRMPIANGSRPHDVPEHLSPVLSQKGNGSGVGLSPAVEHGVFGHAGFSVSTPAFGATPTSPGLTYMMATGVEVGHTVDDNWETYGHGHGLRGERLSYAPTVSTQLGERDPPPPYAP
ncbi:hypothetical protein EJ02DRAFT_455558 [Clathrospora elynae]|uniref:Uncharacterized protein n=1 Tax=Clathrospora elynae TaxID=706981 RepID=A0A6A5SLI9_9PLEO|nr:hypothetical protein EJ02DRAFT_455558 [Clathrospora elynae]